MLDYDPSEPEFVGRIPERESFMVMPSFKCIHWDGDGFPYRKIGTVHHDDSVEFHVPLAEIPKWILGNLVKSRYGNSIIR